MPRSTSINLGTLALAASLFMTSACTTERGHDASSSLASDVLRTSNRHPSAQLFPRIDDRLTWSVATATTVRDSLIQQSPGHGILDLIAYHEAHSEPPCRSLDLLSIKQLPAKPFPARVSGQDELRTYQPTKFLEEWMVKTCGRPTTWLLFNDLGDQTSDLTMLRSSGQGPSQLLRM